jgi:isoquinoline 1-oxidoreductase beta subunit
MGKWTRRGFITAGVIGGGALVVGVALRPGNRNDKLRPYVEGPDEVLVNTWLKIDSANRVTVIVPHSEMGQGAQTVLAQMLADELDAKWDDVSILEAPAEDEYANYALGYGYLFGGMQVPEILVGTLTGLTLQAGKAMHMQITGGSMSIRTTGEYGMRIAGAAAREMLLEAASEAWDVPVEQLRTDQGQIFKSDGSIAAPYSDFAAAAGEKTPPYSPKLKEVSQYRLMGKNIPRRDLPAKVDGSAIFGIDVSVPGMKVATIKAAPVFGAVIDSFDSSSALTLAGVERVVALDDAVAVVADSYWNAKKGLDAVDIRWAQHENSSIDQAAIFEQFESAIDAALASDEIEPEVNVGDANAALAQASSILDVTYRVPYLAHACMEPMNATASVVGDTCEIWVGSQNPLGAKHAVAEALGIPAENIIIHNYLMGGGFGRRSFYDTIVQAAKISQQAGSPIKLVWSREEDMQHDFYRPAFSSRFQAQIDSKGQPVAWRNLFVNKGEPHEAPHIPYAIPNVWIGSVEKPMPIPTGPWRSVDHSQHAFFTESMIDELAHAAKQDPLQFRRALLQDKPRHLAIINRLEELSNWQQVLPEGHGRGIAIHECFGSIVGQVAEVSVRDGRLQVHRVACVADPGFAMSPDGYRAQMESGILYGMSAALSGNIEIQGGAVKQSNFHDYPSVRMGTSPIIEVDIFNSGAPTGGAGEPGTPPIAPAITNAIYAAVGVRVRELPVAKQGFNVA